MAINTRYHNLQANALLSISNNKLSAQSRNMDQRVKFVVLLTGLGLVVATPEYVTRKLCKDGEYWFSVLFVFVSGLSR